MLLYVILASVDCRAFAIKYFEFVEDFNFAVLIPEEKLATWVNIFLRFTLRTFLQAP